MNILRVVSSAVLEFLPEICHWWKLSDTLRRSCRRCLRCLAGSSPSRPRGTASPGTPLLTCQSCLCMCGASLCVRNWKNGFKLRYTVIKCDQIWLLFEGLGSMFFTKSSKFICLPFGPRSPFKKNLLMVNFWPTFGKFYSNIWSRGAIFLIIGHGEWSSGRCACLLS